MDGKRIFKFFLKNKKNIGLIIISFFAFLIFLEFLNYLFMAHDGVYYVWPSNLNKRFLPDSNIMSGVNGESIFTINELGYRGPIIKDKEKEYRILTIGGSTTECLYLDNSETWPNLIMEKLGITKDGRKVIVMNIGKSGHNIRDHIIQLQLINLYEPDLVIFMVGANDLLLRLSQGEAWKPFDENSYDYNRAFSYTPDYNFKSTLTYKIYKSIIEQFNSRIIAQDKVGNVYLVMRTKRMNSNSTIDTKPDLEVVLEDYERNLNRLIEITHGKNASVLFATQPYLWKENMSEKEDHSLWMTTDFNGNYYTTDVMISSIEEFNSRLLDACAENRDVFCIDLEKKVPRSLDYFYDDMHFNEKGAEFVAEQFADYIKNNLGEF